MFSLLLDALDGECMSCFGFDEEDTCSLARGERVDAIFGERGAAFISRSSMSQDCFGELESPKVVPSTTPLSHVSMSERDASSAPG